MALDLIVTKSPGVTTLLVTSSFHTRIQYVYSVQTRAHTCQLLPAITDIKGWSPGNFVELDIFFCPSWQSPFTYEQHRIHHTEGAFRLLPRPKETTILEQGRIHEQYRRKDKHTTYYVTDVGWAYPNAPWLNLILTSQTSKNINSGCGQWFLWGARRNHEYSFRRRKENRGPVWLWCHLQHGEHLPHLDVQPCNIVAVGWAP